MRRIFLYWLFYSMLYITYLWLGFEPTVLTALGIIIGQLTYNEERWQK